MSASAESAQLLHQHLLRAQRRRQLQHLRRRRARRPGRLLRRDPGPRPDRARSSKLIRLRPRGCLTTARQVVDWNCGASVSGAKLLAQPICRPLFCSSSRLISGLKSVWSPVRLFASMRTRMKKRNWLVLKASVNAEVLHIRCQDYRARMHFRKANHGRITEVHLLIFCG